MCITTALSTLMPMPLLHHCRHHRTYPSPPPLRCRRELQRAHAEWQFHRTLALLSDTLQRDRAKGVVGQMDISEVIWVCYLYTDVSRSPRHDRYLNTKYLHKYSVTNITISTNIAIINGISTNSASAMNITTTITHPLE